MSEIRSIFLILITISLLAVIALQVDAAKQSMAIAQTIPTRTPTPGPPTAVPPTSPPNQPTTPPQATAVNTAEPTPTPTITPTATRIPAIFLGVTAEPCGRPPTIWTISTANLRLGPGTDYEIVGNLIYNEARAIIGRAEDAEWWLVPLTETETAWVANNAVTVQGDISQLPIVPAPSIHGATVTPAADAWNPTPNPLCPTITPTTTPTVTPSASASATTMATVTASATIAATETAVANNTTATKPIAHTPTAIVSANTPIAPATAVNDAAQPTAVPLADDGEETAVSNFLLIGGGLLLLGSILLLIFKRKNSG